jgi:cytochrome c peroxidase
MPRARLAGRHSSITNAFALILLGALSACGCGGGSSSGSNEPPPPTGPQRVTLHFEALINGEPFACGQTYDGIGLGSATIDPTDLRLYASEFRLVDADGNETPIELDQDGAWQLENMALLDFEDGTGLCQLQGNEATNVVVNGTVPPGTYTGVRFTIGVPFERNHGDAASAPPPLQYTAMFWNWNAGYKFLRFDNIIDGGMSEFRLHVGSTGCEGDGRGNVSGCENANRVEVALDDFDPASDSIVAELSSLFSDTALEENTPTTPPGCMGAANDPECEGPFFRLGLPFLGQAGGAQQVFYVGKGTGSGPQGPRPSPTANPSSYEWDLPEGFPQPRVPENNPMSAAKVELGRHLFYEKRLSLNETQSCGTCHQQAKAFTDGRTVSLGSTGEDHPRNAQTLTNVAYNPTLTWMSPHLTELEEQLLVPLLGDEPIELGFGGKEDVLIDRLRNDSLYQGLFAEAFPGEAEPITIANVAKAIGSFQRVLISGRSPYDRFVFQGEDDALNESAKRGLQIFFSELLECDHCHGGLNFASSLTHAGNLNDPTPFENNGLFNVGGTGAYPEPNTGLFAFTGEPRDMGRFKPPSLRNIELTAPYMHDGSMATLDEVVDHYTRGGRLIESGPLAGDGFLSPFKSELVTGFPRSEQAKLDLIEFLKSLTDTDFVNDPRFSDPFAAEAAAAKNP